MKFFKIKLIFLNLEVFKLSNLQAPPGVKKNLLRTYESWGQEYVSRTGNVLRSQTLFALAWFHAVVQERRIFIPQVYLNCFHQSGSMLLLYFVWFHAASLFCLVPCCVFILSGSMLPLYFVWVHAASLNCLILFCIFIMSGSITLYFLVASSCFHLSGSLLLFKIRFWQIEISCLWGENSKGHKVLSFHCAFASSCES